MHLHCFEYDRKPSPLLNELCAEVFYYKRDISRTKLFSLKPYIVITRNSPELLKNLLKDNYPILFEGLHSCFFLSDKRLKDRRMIVRTHNIEHDYYTSLGRTEKDLFKKYYFQNEAGKLRRFEHTLTHASGIAAISKNDAEYFSKKYDNVTTVSAFHPNEGVSVCPGKGTFALYHGSLDVGENNEAAMFLTTKVFNDLKMPFIVAGNKASRELKDALAANPNAELRSGITSEDIYELISQAQINILPTFQATGIKLKLLAALFRGRHCLVNTPMVLKTGLESLCVIRDDPKEMKKAVKELMAKPFDSIEIAKREEILLNKGFSNSHNIAQLKGLLFS